jgi:hypothetical protein
VLVLRDAERFAELARPWMADPYSTNVIGARLAIALRCGPASNRRRHLG